MRTLLLLLPFGALVSCAPGATPAPPTAARWAAELEARAAMPQVSGSLTAVRTVGVTTAQIELHGATPNATHPWHVHRGTCETGGGIVGDPGRYPPLRTDAQGHGIATALVEVELEPGQPFHVNVHRAPDDMATIVACGNLQEA